MKLEEYGWWTIIRTQLDHTWNMKFYITPGFKRLEDVLSINNVKMFRVNFIKNGFYMIRGNDRRWRQSQSCYELNYPIVFTNNK